MTSPTRPPHLDAERIGSHRALVARLFPELDVGAFEPVAGGWTCDTYRASGWIVQLPRTADAEQALRRQIEVLPELAGEVSAPVPAPELFSFDPVCMGYREIAGERCELAPASGVWPERLGRFLYDLHLVPPEFLGMRAAPLDGVRDDRRAEWGRLRELASEHMTAELVRTASLAIEGIFDDDGSWRFAPCVTHGDLAPEHVLTTATGDLAGVIDWEEVAIGDPAADFAWSGDMAPAGERALAAYGGAPDAGFVTRSRLWHALIPLHELEHADRVGDRDGVEAGVAAFADRVERLGGSGVSGL